MNYGGAAAKGDVNIWAGGDGFVDYSSTTTEALLTSTLDKDTLLRCGCPSCVKTAVKNGLDLSQLDGVDLSRYTSKGGVAPTSTVGLNGDDVPDNPHSDARFTLSTADGAPGIDSRVNDGTDRDFFRLEVKGGQAYQVDLQGKAGSGDFVLELVDANGAPVLGPDDMPIQSDSSGAGGAERIVFTLAGDGTYFVTVRSFTPMDTGDYVISAKLGDANAGQSLVPTDTIDWGGAANRVNTDGQKDAAGNDVIDVYFAKPGEVYQGLGPAVAKGWNAYEKGQAAVAFNQYSKVANISYREVDSAAKADFVLVTYDTAPVLLGRMSPPGEADEGQGEFNQSGVGWDENPTAEASGLEQGGYGFITLIHEFGHGHGLAHPHDTGGGSTIMRGVESDSDPGEFNLNQGIHTTMSYRSGAPNGPDGGSPSDNYGYEGTLSAFDIAVIQAKYGANLNYNKGDNTYVLKDVNASGTFYECLWDAGGVDTIRYDGARAVAIDLRAATLQYEFGGGGFLSFARGIFGGFTIANGTVIENAHGGSGADILVGNAAANQLAGGAGDDQVNGGDGEDRLFGEDGGDVMIGGIGADQIYGQTGGDRLFGEVGKDTIHGGLGDDQLYGQEDDDTLEGQDGSDFLVGGAGRDFMNGGVGDDRLYGEADADKLIGGEGFDQLFGQDGNDTLFGENGGDLLGGGAGDDLLLGQGGGDTLLGEAGADRFIYTATTHSNAAGTDRIVDFDAGEGDLIDLSQIDADTRTAGDQSFAFVSGFSGQAGQAVLVYAADSNTSVLFADTDGDARADFVLHVAGVVQTSAGWVL